MEYILRGRIFPKEQKRLCNSHEDNALCIQLSRKKAPAEHQILNFIGDKTWI